MGRIIFTILFQKSQKQRKVLRVCMENLAKRGPQESLISLGTSIVSHCSLVAMVMVMVMVKVMVIFFSLFFQFFFGVFVLFICYICKTIHLKNVGTKKIAFVNSEENYIGVIELLNFALMSVINLDDNWLEYFNHFSRYLCHPSVFVQF